jgi:ribosomal protein L11 methylase PrmA
VDPIRSHASFRDPSGHVYVSGGRVLRTVSRSAAPAYEFVRDRGLLRRWIERGWVVDTREAPLSALGALAADAPAYVLEHARVPFVSYPYEWSFAALKCAALLHLDLQRDALDRGVELSDASAYNVQFTGTHPVFIDVLSFRPYAPGRYWTAHRQFCHQFLNPLLLRAFAGVPHNAWFRGGLEGIPTTELNQLLPTLRKLSWNVFSHVTLPARIEAKLARQALSGGTGAPRRPLPEAAYLGLLEQLRRWIAKLEPRGQAQTTWSEYETGHTYLPDEHGRKRAFVEAFARDKRPAVLWDFGCNTGEYSELALREGAGVAIGFEADHGALERAFHRGATKKLAFVPLYLDAANPSPDQGWNQQERAGLAARGPADAVLALAFTHHLAIGRNIPLDMLLDWLTACAPAGVIEFVPKTDPTVQRMLENREDIFREYTEEAFTNLLSARARIVRSEVTAATGRRLFAYDDGRG